MYILYTLLKTLAHVQRQCTRVRMHMWHSIGWGLLLCSAVASPACGMARMHAWLATRNATHTSALALPRFGSIRGQSVNMRTEPDLHYPVRWVLVRETLPVEVVASFEQWYRIRTYEHDEGWIHESMLSNKHYALVVGEVLRPLYAHPDGNANRVAQLEPHVIVALTSCKAGWCAVHVQHYDGFMPTQALWGVPHEDF
jgi:SH3-like domain-containing protein